MTEPATGSIAHQPKARRHSHDILDVDDPIHHQIQRGSRGDAQPGRGHLLNIQRVHIAVVVYVAEATGKRVQKFVPVANE